jgi:hypothetical protein
MSVYYYEGAKILAPLTILSNEPMFDVDTVSLKKQRASQNAQRWEISFNTIGESATQADMFLSSIKNLEQAKTMVIPQLPEVDNTITVSTSTPAIAGTSFTDDTSVSLQPSVASGIIPKGTFFKFSNQDKIYVTTNEVNLGSASPTVGFYPRLKLAVTSLNTLMLRDHAVLSYYTSIDNQSGITFSDGVLSNAGTITVIEALQ